MGSSGLASGGSRSSGPRSGASVSQTSARLNATLSVALSELHVQTQGCRSFRHLISAQLILVLVMALLLLLLLLPQLLLQLLLCKYLPRRRWHEARRCRGMLLCRCVSQWPLTPMCCYHTFCRQGHDGGWCCCWLRGCCRCSRGS